MLSIKHISVFFLFLLFATELSAQFVNYGTDPASFKWRQAKTKNYKLIYPEGLDSIAYRYAKILETVFKHETKTIGNASHRRYPVVMHPSNMLSNGMVSWAPRRMEILTTPHPNKYSQSWDMMLAVHESRHMLQMNNLTQGMVRPFYFISGEQIAGISAGFIPRWFLEGDAVATETAMTNSGRGRFPEFNMPFRAQKLSSDFYSFDKWSLGSYKDYTGDIYAFGYNIVAFARRQYGEDVWAKVINRYTRKIPTGSPFHNAIGREMGINTTTLFNQTFSYLGNEWERLDSLYFLSGFEDITEKISPENKSYTSYKHPYATRGSGIIAIKSSLKDSDAIVLIKDSEEKHLSYVGRINSKLIYNNDRIYWTENVTGLRWVHENYSDLRYYDMKTKRISSITTRQRFNNPAINDEGKLAAVSENSIYGWNSIKIINIKDGKVLTSFSTPDNVSIQDIVFINQHEIAAISVSDKGSSIIKLDTKKGEWTVLLDSTFANLSSLFIKDEQLLFESGVNGTNNVYFLHLPTSKTLQATNARFGIFHPTISDDNHYLLFSDYQANGHSLARVSLDRIKSEQYNFKEPYINEFAEIVSEQENFILDTATIKDVRFEPKAYKKRTKLFNIHSWAPVFYDIASIININSDNLSTVVKPGASIISQNELNTMISQLGWYYENGEHHGKIALTYMGWYPIFDLTIDYGGKAIERVWGQDNDGKLTFLGTHLPNKRIEGDARVYVPFNLNKNNMIRGFQPSLSYHFTNNRYQQIESGAFRNYQYLLSELRFYNYTRLAANDILPRWGYQLRLQNVMVPFGSENHGSLYTARLTGYMPGLIKNNGLMLNLGYQFQSIDGKPLFIAKQLLNSPRGYNYQVSTRQMLTLNADYSFSIICPDFSIGTMAYIKRVRSNIFFDVTKDQINIHEAWNTASSYGADLIFDCNLFRFGFPLSIGARIIKPINFGETQVESLFSISF